MLKLRCATAAAYALRYTLVNHYRRVILAISPCDLRDLRAHVTVDPTPYTVSREKAQIDISEISETM